MPSAISSDPGWTRIAVLTTLGSSRAPGSKANVRSAINSLTGTSADTRARSPARRRRSSRANWPGTSSDSTEYTARHRIELVGVVRGAEVRRLVEHDDLAGGATHELRREPTDRLPIGDYLDQM